MDLDAVRERVAEKLGDQVDDVWMSVRDHGAMVGVGVRVGNWRHAVVLGGETLADADQAVGHLLVWLREMRRHHTED